MKQLLSYGANANQEDAVGKNAYDWAEEGSNSYTIRRVFGEFLGKKAILIGLERQFDEDLSMVSAFLETSCSLGRVPSNELTGKLAEMIMDCRSVQALIPQDSGTDIESVEVKPSTYAMRRCSRNSDSD